MSVTQPTRYDFEDAWQHGLTYTHGDPEVLEDLGIPVDANLAEAQIESGKRVAQLEQEQAAQRTGYIAINGVLWATPERQAANHKGNLAAKANIRPLGGGKAEEKLDA
jgi:hypothetical protein